MSEQNTSGTDNNDQADKAIFTNSMTSIAADVVEGGVGTSDAIISTVPDDYLYAMAETSYVGLSELIGKKITEAIESGKILVQEKPTVMADHSEGTIYSYGPVDFGHWHMSLPQSRQQHYNCDYCKQAWPVLTSIAILNDDGSLTYPLHEAILEFQHDPIVAKMLRDFPSMRDISKRRASVLPLGRISGVVIKQQVGGFDHFHGCERSVWEAYNAAHTSFADIKYVQTLFDKFSSKDLNPIILEKIFQYVKGQKGMREDTALSRADELVALLKQIRKMMETSPYAFTYLWSLLQKNDKAWLRHAYSSMLGMVLDAAVEMRDTDNMELALVRVKELAAKAAAPENYKNKTAEASEASLDQCVKFLHENNFQGSLSRRLLPLEEVNDVFWIQSEPGADQPAVEEKPMSALERARQQLKTKRDPDTSTISKLDEILGKVVNEKRMSVSAFIDGLADYATLAVSHETVVLAPVFVTGAVEEGNHDGLLNFDKRINEFGSLLQAPQPIPYQYVASLAEMEPGMLPMAPEIPVMAVFKSNRITSNEVYYVLHVENVGFNFQQAMVKHGTCIMGSMIKTEHFGYSRAIVDLSRNMQMNVDAGKSAAGGIFLMVGTIFNAVRKDGTKEKIILTSVN